MLLSKPSSDQLLKTIPAQTQQLPIQPQPQPQQQQQQQQPPIQPMPLPSRSQPQQLHLAPPTRTTPPPPPLPSHMQGAPLSSLQPMPHPHTQHQQQQPQQHQHQPSHEHTMLARIAPLQSTPAHKPAFSQLDEANPHRLAPLSLHHSHTPQPPSVPVGPVRPLVNNSILPLINKSSHQETQRLLGTPGSHVCMLAPHWLVFGCASASVC